MKSFVALLVVALALTATAQSNGCLTAPTSAYNSSYVPTSVATFVAASCAQCGSGFLLTSSQGSTCTACPAGCSWCTNSTYCLSCTSGYQFVAAATGAITQSCMSCGSNAATCTVSGTTVTILTCNTGYYLLSGSCASCGTASTGAASTTPSGIVGCSSCTAVGIQASTVYYVTCKACSAGYVFWAAGTGITVPYCTAYTAAGSVTGTTITGNTYGTAGTVTVQASTAGLQPWVSCVTAGACTIGYTSAASTYFCVDKSTYTTASASVCVVLDGEANTGAFTLAGSASTLIGTCTSGTYALAGTGIWCNTCSGTTVLYASSTSTTCIAAIAGCAVYGSATTCTACQSGFNYVSSTSCTACAAGVACSSGYCGGALALNVSGLCVTATQISGCLFHNGTSGNCAICQAGFASVAGVCGNCPSSCAYCTSSTACAVCNANYVLSSGACSAKTASNPNSGKFLFAGLAFISMIFYYIF